MQFQVFLNITPCRLVPHGPAVLISVTSNLPKICPRQRAPFYDPLFLFLQHTVD